MTKTFVCKRATLGQYLVSTVTHPQTVFADLVDNPRGKAFAALVLGTVALLYSLVEWFLYQQHYTPIPPPFLRISTDQYYACLPSQEVTTQYPDLVTHLRSLADEIAGAGSVHEIHLYRRQETSADPQPQKTPKVRIPELDVVVHSTFPASAPLSQVHLQTEQIKRVFRQAHPTLGTITLHAEPPEEESTQQRIT